MFCATEFQITDSVFLERKWVKKKKKKTVMGQVWVCVGY